MLTDLADARDLPYASTLCGACQEACPVNINIPRMLLYLRKKLTHGERYPDQRSRSSVEALAFKVWRASVASPFMLKLANMLGRVLQAPFARAGHLRRLPPPLSGWTRHRTFPAVSSRPFRQRWREYLRADGAPRE